MHSTLADIAEGTPKLLTSKKETLMELWAFGETYVPFPFSKEPSLLSFKN